MLFQNIVNFTPLSALAGGVLIGLGAALLLFANGRIAGISGITAGLAGVDKRWRLFFIAGLVISGTGLPYWLNWPWPAYTTPAAGVMIAGLLVGFGSRLGSGCTSGHGVCGLARLSWRSLVAVMVFMLSAMATVYVMRHLLAGGGL